jgi:predicted enzyme related to lactoylglutathione lyase
MKIAANAASSANGYRYRLSMFEANITPSGVALESLSAPECATLNARPPGVGRRLVDPGGRRHCHRNASPTFAQGSNGSRRRCYMAGNPVRWFEIYVQDMARAKAFYEAVFGARLEKLNSGDIDMWAFPMDRTRSGTGGALVRMPGVPSGGNSTLVYFGSDDCAIEASRVVSAGGRVHRDKLSIGEYGFIALAVDTEGNMFGIHSLA